MHVFLAFIDPLLNTFHSSEPHKAQTVLGDATRPQKEPLSSPHVANGGILHAEPTEAQLEVTQSLAAESRTMDTGVSHIPSAESLSERQEGQDEPVEIPAPPCQTKPLAKPLRCPEETSGAPFIGKALFWLFDGRYDRYVLVEDVHINMIV